jgi:glycosyltransferase involved in cell wall biosynthesis
LRARILIILDSDRWSGRATISKMVEHISPEFRCSWRTGRIYEPGDEKYEIVYIHCNFSLRRDSVRWFRRRNRRSKLLCGVRGFLGLSKTRGILRLFDAVNVSNLDLLREVQRLNPKTFLCHAGVDTNLFKPGSSTKRTPFTVGWVGAKDRANKNFKLLPKLGFRYRVASFPGQGSFRPHHKMPRFYHSVDAVVMLSQFEGCPLPVLEAMACGLPVVSHATGAAKEMLNEFQLVREWPRTLRGFELFKSKLTQLQQDPELRRRLGAQNRRETVKNWSWPVKVKQYEKFFRSVL